MNLFNVGTDDLFLKSNSHRSTHATLEANREHLTRGHLAGDSDAIAGDQNNDEPEQTAQKTTQVCQTLP